MVTPYDKQIDNYAELTACFRDGVAGNADAYSRFFQEISVLIRRMIARKLPAGDIEDVLQEVLISVHKARHTWDGDRPLMPWLFAIAHFRINDHLRKLYARREIDIEIVSETLADVTKALGEDESIEELLEHIPERERRILTMMYMEGYTAKETGNRLDMKESAVKVAAHRAIKKIRERFGT